MIKCSHSAQNREFNYTFGTISFKPSIVSRLMPFCKKNEPLKVELLLVVKITVDPIGIALTAFEKSTALA